MAEQEGVVVPQPSDAKAANPTVRKGASKGHRIEFSMLIFRLRTRLHGWPELSTKWIERGFCGDHQKDFVYAGVDAIEATTPPIRQWSGTLAASPIPARASTRWPPRRGKTVARAADEKAQARIAAPCLGSPLMGILEIHSPKPES